jgi:rSAM/selenodomain-associated transferase 1
MTGTFGMFVRFPERGRVKTRLAAEIGDDLAQQVYIAFLQDLVARFRDLRARRVLAFTPNTEQARSYFQNLGQGLFELWPQPEGTLGQRLEAFFESCGPAPTVLIGSDSPTLNRDDVEQALLRLSEVDCVLGPATDGGVYLIGLRNHAHAQILRQVEWSTSRVLDQLVSGCQRRSLTLQSLPLWYDIDTLDDLHFLRGHLQILRQAQPELRDTLFHTRNVIDVLTGQQRLQSGLVDRPA